MTTTCTECYKKILEHTPLETSACLSRLSNRLNEWTVGNGKRALEAFSVEQRKRIGLYRVISKLEQKLEQIRELTKAID